MAMNNSNFGYLPVPAPFSSTPTNIRSQRPRFAYSGPPSYPRPRSSASKPNPGSDLEDAMGMFGNTDNFMDFSNSNYGSSDAYLTPYGNSDSFYDPMRNGQRNSESMYNNYGNSVRHADMSMSSKSSPYHDANNSYLSQNSTAYYSCNESFVDSPRTAFVQESVGLNYLSPPNSQMAPMKPHKKKNSLFPTNMPGTKRYFVNKNNQLRTNPSLQRRPPFRNKKKIKKDMADKSEYRCTLCGIDFTSSIPYEMHLRGAKHAKKIKTQDALQSIQEQVAKSKEIAPLGNIFRCDLCNIMLNSSLQLQTHLDGAKHKNKLLQQQLKQIKKETEAATAETEAVAPKTEAVAPETETAKPDTETAKPDTGSQVNGKSNCGTVRPLPSDFDEPQPTKMAKFSCEICNLAVNSDIQLQQHLTSKRHQAKVEGKPFPKKNFKRKLGKTGNTESGVDAAEIVNTDEPEKNNEAVQNEAVQNEAVQSNGTPKMVMGVKTLSSSFVQGESLK